MTALAEKHAANANINDMTFLEYSNLFIEIDGNKLLNKIGINIKKKIRDIHKSISQICIYNLIPLC